MIDTYGEMLSQLVDEIAKYEDRADVFRRNDISRNHFYNVTNKNRESSSGKPYYCPVEWVVMLTRDSKKYTMLRRVAKDCRCILITPEDVEELKSLDGDEPEKVMAVIKKIMGMLK